MKIQYFGDRHDWRKYRIISRIVDSGFSVGLFWMLTPPDGGSDGNHDIPRNDTASLSAQEQQTLNFLKEHRQDRDHGFNQFQIQNPLKVGQFFDEFVPIGGQERIEYMRRGLAKLSSTDLIFFDPDNGLEISSVGYRSKKSQKFIFANEIKAFWEAGKSIVIYQHKPFLKIEDIVKEKTEKLRRVTGDQGIIKFVSLPNVLFIFLLKFENDFIKIRSQLESCEIKNLEIVDAPSDDLSVAPIIRSENSVHSCVCPHCGKGIKIGVHIAG